MIVEILEEIEDFFDEVDLYSTKVRAGILTMDESERIDEWSDRVITEMLEEIEETRSFKGKRGVYNPSAVAGNIWRD